MDSSRKFLDTPRPFETQEHSRNHQHREEHTTKRYLYFIKSSCHGNNCFVAAIRIELKLYLSIFKGYNFCRPLSMKDPTKFII